MKLTSALIGVLLAGSVSAFDKWRGWGKRNYPCINIIQGIPENATITPGTAITLVFNRDSKNCPDVDKYTEASEYTLELFNNPFYDLDAIKPAPAVLDYKFTENLATPKDPEAITQVTININSPSKLNVTDPSAFYLYMLSSLPNAPQSPSIFSAMGPFTIKEKQENNCTTKRFSA